MATPNPKSQYPSIYDILTSQATNPQLHPTQQHKLYPQLHPSQQHKQPTTSPILTTQTTHNFTHPNNTNYPQLHPSQQHKQPTTSPILTTQTTHNFTHPNNTNYPQLHPSQQHKQPTTSPSQQHKLPTTSSIPTTQTTHTYNTVPTHTYNTNPFLQPTKSHNPHNPTRVNTGIFSWGDGRCLDGKKYNNNNNNIPLHATLGHQPP
ncbi:hypothetical protein Pcinc_034450 [Petrolisthes cinctipes]|uniref:Uncharacterized protein n=1 Tax=Petrolisthes cinctipes TaxID=88211 RepID=A0AAE1JZY4_PETCI|nr:hypothetical protein Pcinc_034450 [Petrolisthes cinctipes]